ncbi:uncharacterized protein LOC117322164 [Pecten maximus]|uniref:uncharacterized protein LOC117322164 n=1 Tax=Pecten maximus TaxID=6579 RepID=UPI001458A076|nr:uncharacterized protein LOC117322164 [Pecten maximus]
MQYIKRPSNQELLAHDGVPMQRQTSEAREEDTYVKKPFRVKSPATSPPILDPPDLNSESSFPTMEYNDVKVDINTSPYHSSQNIHPGYEEPKYVHFQRKPDDPGNLGNLDLGGVIKQLVPENKEKNSDSGTVINIGHITIHNNPADPTYYDSLQRRPPEPCLPNHYDYPGPQRGYHGNQGTATTPEEEIYIRLPDKTAVEHSQSSVNHDHHKIDPYRETKNFLPNSRSPSCRTQDTQTEQTEAENSISQVMEDGPAQITIQHRNSGGPPNAFDVQLTLKDSKQRWIGELKPSPTLESNPVPLSSLDLSENTYDSHTKSPDRHYPKLSQVMGPVRTSLPTERSLETVNTDLEMTDLNDDGMTTLSDEHTVLKLPKSSEGEARGYIRQPAPPVENPVYMQGSVCRAPRMNGKEGSSIRTNEYQGSLNLNKGWSMSTPDMRHVVPTPTRSSWGSPIHQCEVDGFFSVHDERAIEEAKAMLENSGEDGNWLVTSAVRQPMQSYYLHFRLLGKTNSFPINRVKGKRIAIDTSSSTSFSCLCKLIKHYTQKKNLPGLDKKLGNAFIMSTTSSTRL